MGTLSSFNILLSQTAPHAATVAPLYSVLCLTELLLVAPRYGSVAKGEDEGRCGWSVGFVASPIGIGVPFELNQCGRFVEVAEIHGSTHIP